MFRLLFASHLLYRYSNVIQFSQAESRRQIESNQVKETYVFDKERYAMEWSSNSTLRTFGIQLSGGAECIWIFLDD